MKNTINWNHKNRKILEHMWSEGASDKEITAFFGCGAWAVAKQRSHMGLVLHKKQKGLKRSPNVMGQLKKEWKLLAYMIDDRMHFARIGGAITRSAEDLAHMLLNNNKAVKEVVVLRPALTITRTSVEEHI